MNKSFPVGKISDLVRLLDNRVKDLEDVTPLSVSENKGIVRQDELFNKRLATGDLSKYRLLRQFDLAYNPYLLWTGAVGQWRGDYLGAVSPVYISFRAKPEHDPQFVGYLFESELLTPYFDATAIGSIERRRRTKPQDFLDAPVHLPPLAEQRRIVDLVGAIDTCIDALETQIEATRTARAGVLAELLSTPGDDWQTTTLGEVAEINPESVKGRDPTDVIQYVDIGSVSAELGIDLESVESFNMGDAPSRAKRGIRTSDVLVSTVRPNLRAFSVVPNDLDGEVASTGFAVLRAGEQILPGFIWSVVSSKCFVDYLMTRVTGSNYPAVKASDIAGHVISLPSLSEQRRIVDLVGAIDTCIDALEVQVEADRIARAGVLAELLSGEHRLPESYDKFVEAS